MGELAHTVPLGPREPAFSFLSRLAARNKTDIADFALDMGLGFSNVIAGKPETLEALADLAQISFDDLHAWTPTYASARKYSFRGEMFHARGLHSTTIYGCPACLREDAQTNDSIDAMAIRAPWLVHHVTCCMKHELPLVKLWAETASHPRHDTASRLREIAPTILSGALDPKPRAIGPFDHWIHARLDGIRTDSWLDQFGLHPGAHFCELVGRAALATKFPKWMKFEQSDLHRSTRVGFDLVSPGQAYLRDALYHLQGMMGTAYDGPKKKFGDLYDRLSNDLLGPEYAPFRNLLRDHIATTWPLGPGDMLMGEPVLERRNHSVLTAARETGIDPRRMRKLLIEAGFIKPSKTEYDDAWNIFDAKASASFLASLSHHVSTIVLQGALCISRSLFDSLRKDGYFVPALKGKNHKPLWDRVACQERFDALMCGAEPIYVAMHDWCDLSMAAHRLKIRPSEILAMIEDGRLTRIGKYQGYRGLSALLIPLEEAERAFERPEAKGQSIELFAKSVGIRPAAAMKMVRAGYIPSTEGRNPKTKGKQRYLTSDDIAAYHALFVALRPLAKRLGKTWQQLNAELTTAKIAPFAPDGCDLGAVFEWASLEPLGIKHPAV